MNIICPTCRFARAISADRLPKRSVIATCPQCGQRFRVIREGQGDALSFEPLPPVERTPASSGADDPLPPGAVIPPRVHDACIADDLDVPHRQHTATNTRTVSPDATQRHASDAAKAPQKNDTRPRDDGHLRATEGGFPDMARQSQQTDAPRRPMPPDAVGELDSVSNPWDAMQELGFFPALYQTITRVMFAAPRFFLGLREDAPLMRALCFYLLVGVLEIIIEQSWSDIISRMLEAGGASDPNLQQFIEILRPQTNIFMTVLLRAAFVTIEIFATAGIFFLAFRLIAPNNANFQLLFQVIAYSSAPALLCVVPLVGSVAGFVWGLACTFVGCRYALRLTWGQTLMGLIPLYILWIPTLMLLVQAVQPLG